MSLAVKTKIIAAISAALAGLGGLDDPTQYRVGLVILPGSAGGDTEQRSDQDRIAEVVSREGAAVIEMFVGGDEPVESFGSQSGLEVFRFEVGLLVHLPANLTLRVGATDRALRPAEAAAELHSRIMTLYAGAGASDDLRRGRWPTDEHPDGLAITTYCGGGGGGPSVDDGLATLVTTHLMVVEYRIDGADVTTPR